MIEIVYNGNKLVLYNSGMVTAFFEVGDEDDMQIDSHDFNSIDEAREWLDKMSGEIENTDILEPVYNENETATYDDEHCTAHIEYFKYGE